MDATEDRDGNHPELPMSQPSAGNSSGAAPTLISANSFCVFFSLLGGAS
jgi:hypothetical protein